MTNARGKLEDRRLQSDLSSVIKPIQISRVLRDAKYFLVQSCGIYEFLCVACCGGQIRNSIRQASKKSQEKMHRPGIEPGTQRWQRYILPLN